MDHDDVRYAPRFGIDIRVKPDGQSDPAKRACDRPGCPAEGSHRAPQGPDKLNQYYWFCVDHAREYNLSWDYFKGMSAAEVDAYQRAAMTGHRPTWKLGLHQTPGFKDKKLRAIFGMAEGMRVFQEGPGHIDGDRKPAVRQRSKLQLQALEQLNLEATATWAEVRLRYKDLVKKFHPDANGGDRSAEDRLKAVIKAYGQLRSSGFS
jgi:curved DNA-binding protein CbpA